MSKIKRPLAMLIAVLMLCSMLTVFAFAADAPEFAQSYVDSTGKIGKGAFLVDPALAGENGSKVEYAWDGSNYSFTVGTNAFKTVSEVYAYADNNSIGNIQILLPGNMYDEILAERESEFFGVNWNTNPNAVNPDDPTQKWEQNPEYTAKMTNVGNIVINVGTTGNIAFYGLTVCGRICDNYRGKSAIKTSIRFENILLQQTAEAVGVTPSLSASTPRSSALYAIWLWNYNSNSNKNDTDVSNNVDEVYFVNFRFDKLAGGCTRYIDEQFPPTVVFDGVYLDYNITGNNQMFWMKWNVSVPDINLTMQNSMLVGSTERMGVGNWFNIQATFGNGFTTQLDDSKGVLTMSKNVFLDVVNNDSTLIRIYGTFEEVHIDENIVLNTKTDTTHTFFARVDASSGTTFWDPNLDYSDKITVRNNIIIGMSQLDFPVGKNGGIDATGTFITNKAAEPGTDWRTFTSTMTPTGYMKYDYCYLDAKRTKKSSDIPPFKVNGQSVTGDAITVTAPAGTLSTKPTVEADGEEVVLSYYFCPSDTSFSNVGSFTEADKVEDCVLENNENHFLLVVKSYDGKTEKAYKLTINKEKTSVEPGDIEPLSDGISATKDGLVYNVQVSGIEDGQSASFKFGSSVTVEEYQVITDANSKFAAGEQGAYTIKPLEFNETVVVRFKLKAGDQSEYFYVYFTRQLSNKCDLIAVGGAEAKDENTYYAHISGEVQEIVLTPELPEGAECYLWRDTTVYPIQDGAFRLVGIASGVNVFTLGVLAENKIDSKLYSLEIEKDQNTEAKVYSVEGATAEGDGFTVTVRNRFTVKPTVSTGATFKVYADASCTTLIEDNVVAVTADRTVYIVVTSEDGKTISNPVPVVIHKNDEGISVAGGSSDAGLCVVRLANNLTETTLEITANNATYQLYADKKLTTPAAETVKLDQGATYVYAKVTYTDGETETVTIKVVSPRTSVSYKDASSLPSWSKKYIDALNADGSGIIRGDNEGKFNPSSNITRYEIAAVSVRLLGIDATQYANVQLGYTDNIPAWALNYVKAVTKLGIMSGSNDLSGKLVFNGQGAATRAQLAKIIVELSFFDNGMSQTVAQYYRANQQAVDAAYDAYAFADDAAVQNWAKTYVRMAVFAGYINGKPEGSVNYIKGNDSISRAEVAAIAARYLGLAE